MAMQRLGRERSRPQSVELDAELLEDPEPNGQEEEAWKSELGPYLTDCMGELSQKSQNVLKLRYHLDLSYEQIGGMLGGTRQYIGRLLHKCQEKLKKCIERKLAKRVATKEIEKRAWS
jgi:RNA polymerase sigma factor (sigma-70 family)